MTLLAMRGRTLEVLATEPNPAESTFPSEILTCRTPEGETLRLFRKRAGDAGHECHGHRRGIVYEASPLIWLRKFVST